MDHLELFNAVKGRDTAQLQKVLGPTLINFAAYQVVNWDHAEKGILTSLNALPGAQGYESLRWAEHVLVNSHQKRELEDSDPDYAECVYRLRADLLSKALERVNDFEPLERPAIRASVDAAIDRLHDALVDPAGQDHLDHFHGGRIGHPFAADKL